MTNLKNYVLKRDGRIEQICLDKITSRIQKLCYGLNMDYVDPVAITIKVCSGLYTGITTVELDTLAAELAATMSTVHPDYAILAARIAVSNLHKETKKQFTDVIDDLFRAIDLERGRRIPLISETHHTIIMKNAALLNSSIIYDRDFSYDYFGFKILENSYLLKINGKVVERPQHMLMRVSIGIHGEDIDSAIETYNYMSAKYFIHSSATLFSAATPRPLLSSAYVITMPADSLEAIYKCITQCALISNADGNMGVSVHNIRAKGSGIAGTNGISNGVAPMLRVFNNSACLVEHHANNQPTQAIYLEPWHSDIFEFLDLKKKSGKEESKARDLVYAIWICDLFMKRIKTDEKWSLMCPHLCQGLSDCWGREFEQLYEKYEAEGRFVKQVRARDVWSAICMSQIEIGTPYVLYKDACNRKSNQQHLGTIKSGSFSTEIVAYTSPDEIAVCNRASIALNMFVDLEQNNFDFEKLKEVTKAVTRNLNKTIDVSTYPLPEAKISNLRHRPIGIGVQGLADAFIMLRIPFVSKKARLLNKQIFETLYYGAVEASSEIAEKDGPYPAYEGSPISKGILQYEMWGVTPTNLWDWSALKQRTAKHGVRNSLLVALMPTAATAAILGNNESTEPLQSNIYNKEMTTGKFQVINKHLLQELTQKRIFDDSMRKQILENRGSIQNIAEIPDDLKLIYKTVWEISQKDLIQMAADRGPFIDQSQSMNIHLAKPDYVNLSSMHFHGWERGLKTGMYHLKTNQFDVPVVLNGEGTQVLASRINGEEKKDKMKKIVEDEDAAFRSSR